MRIDQVTPDLVGRDAVGVHMLNAQHALRSAGIDSEIFYESATDEMRDRGRPIEEIFEPAPDRRFLFQMAIGSPGLEMMKRVSDPVMIHYHNITPAPLLNAWEPEIAAGVKYGREQLAEFVRFCALGLGVSRYNELELIDLGYSPTAIAPLLLDMRHEGRQPDAQLLANLRNRPGPLLLYVGKISPHKAPHDLVNALKVVRELYAPDAHLALVGSPLGTTYVGALKEYIESLELGDAVEIVGGLSGDELEAYWHAADVYVSASKHEGFCAPLVEAMGHGLPVVANAAAAVPETIDDAGLLVDDGSPLTFAATIHRVLTDASLRTSLIERGHARAEYFDLDRASTRFVDAVTQPLR